MARFVAAAVAALLVGCVTPAEKKQMQGDIFNVQTRLLSLEQVLTETSKDAKSSGDQAAKRIAQTGANIERFQRDLQEIRGEIDVLKVGVTTGALPGQDPAQEGTLAHRLDVLTQRLEAVEEAQAELLDVIRKAGGARGAAKGKDKGKQASSGRAEPKGPQAAANANDLQKAFDAKRYKQVSEDAPKLVKSGSAGEQEKVRFLWAESLFKLGKMRDAALRFNEYVENNPQRSRLPLAKMRIGDCFRHLGDGATARLYYEELIQEFPDSEEASKARERLAETGLGNTAEKG